MLHALMAMFAFTTAQVLGVKRTKGCVANTKKTVILRQTLCVPYYTGTNQPVL